MKSLPFPRPPELPAETPITRRIICQIGADRLAIEFNITELSPERVQVIPIQKKRPKGKRRRRVKRMPRRPPI